MPSIAIIGAGCSGLAAAHTVRAAGWQVTLYEQSQRAGGRATTRARAGFTFDPGAQYIKRGNSASIELITERFATPDLIDITKPVWIFDGAGHIAEGDHIQNAEPKWNYRHGLLTLPRLMTANLDIRYETPIHHVRQTSTGWALLNSNGRVVGVSDYLLVSIPAPRALTLLEASEMDRAVQQAIQEQLSPARYNPLISVALGYRPRPVARPYYALVNTDKAHAVSWLAWEHEKAPERAPEDAGLLIAQMAPQYSRDHWDGKDEEIVQDVAHHVRELIGEALPTPYFADIERWPEALPTTKANGSALNALTLPSRLAFCGDGYVGGRVHLALEHGMEVARQVLNLNS